MSRPSPEKRYSAFEDPDIDPIQRPSETFKGESSSAYAHRVSNSESSIEWQPQSSPGSQPRESSLRRSDNRASTKASRRKSTFQQGPGAARSGLSRRESRAMRSRSGSLNSKYSASILSSSSAQAVYVLKQRLAAVNTQFELTEEQKKKLEEQKQKNERHKISMEKKQTELVKLLSDLRKQIVGSGSTEGDSVATFGDVKRVLESLSVQVGKLTDSYAIVSERSLKAGFAEQHYETVAKTTQATSMAVIKDMFGEEAQEFWSEEEDEEEQELEKKEHKIEEHHKEIQKNSGTVSVSNQRPLSMTVRQQLARTLSPMRPVFDELDESGPQMTAQARDEASEPGPEESPQKLGGLFFGQDLPPGSLQRRETAQTLSSTGQLEVAEDSLKKSRKNKQNEDKRQAIRTMPTSSQSPGSAASVISQSSGDAPSTQSGDGVAAKGSNMGNVQWPGSEESSSIGNQQPEGDGNASEPASSTGPVQPAPLRSRGATDLESTSEMIRRMLQEPMTFGTALGEFDFDEPRMEFGLSLEQELNRSLAGSLPPSLPTSEPASAKAPAAAIPTPQPAQARFVGAPASTSRSAAMKTLWGSDQSRCPIQLLPNTGAMNELGLEMPQEPLPVMQTHGPLLRAEPVSLNVEEFPAFEDPFDATADAEPVTELHQDIKEEKGTVNAEEVDPAGIRLPGSPIKGTTAPCSPEAMVDIEEGGKEAGDANTEEVDPASVPLPVSAAILAQKARAPKAASKSKAQRKEDSPTKPVIPPIVDDTTWSELSISSLIKDQVHPWWNLLHCLWILFVVNPFYANAAIALEFRAWLRWHVLGRRSYWHVPRPGRIRMTLRSVVVVLIHCFLALTAQVWVATTREREIWERANGTTRVYLISRVYKDPSVALLPGVDPNLMIGGPALAAVAMGAMHFMEDVMVPKLGEFQVDLLTAVVPIFLFG